MFPSIGALRARCDGRQRISREARPPRYACCRSICNCRKEGRGAPLPTSAGVLSIGKRLLDQLDDLRLVEQLAPLVDAKAGAVQHVAGAGLHDLVQLGGNGVHT